jgi:hypothetical protein
VCNQTRDCPGGQRCVVVDGPKVCQLASESSCSHNSDCADPLVCARDGTCRNACMANRDCTIAEVCAKSGVCAEPSELDASGDIPTR